MNSSVSSESGPPQIEPQDTGPSSPESYGVVVARHGLKEGDKLTAGGRQEALKKGSAELASLVDSLPERSIFVMVGVSEKNRTRETMEAFGEGLRTAVETSGKLDDCIMVYPRSGVAIGSIAEADARKVKSAAEGNLTGTVRTINELGKQYPDKKFIISTPLQVKGIGEQWMYVRGGDGSLELHPYFQALDDKGISLDQQFFLWLREYTRARESNEDFSAPNPEDVGKRSIEAIGKTKDFVRRHLDKDQQGRPVTICVVGHSYSIDLLLILMGNSGRLTTDAIDKFEREHTEDLTGSGEESVAGKLIRETEFANLTFSGGSVEVEYRGHRFGSNLGGYLKIV